MTYIAGIDAGTSGVKVSLFDTSGNIVSRSYEEYPCEHPSYGWVEQDMELVWEKLCKVSKNAISQSEISPRDIESIGLSSQRGTFVGVDRDWNCLHNSIVWNDTRAKKEVRDIKERLDEGRYYEITGVPLTEQRAYPKFKWLIDNRPKMVSQTWKFVTGQEWLLNKLGSNNCFSDPSPLTLHGMMDVRELDWSRELLELIDLDQGKLPPVDIPMKEEGAVSKGASKATGFTEGTPICRGGGDHQCAAIGAGIIEEGMAEVTIGTSAVAVAHLDSLDFDSSRKVLLGGHAIPEKWDMEGLSHSAGCCLKSWRDNLGVVERNVSNQMGLDPYKLIDHQAKLAPPGSNGCIYLPFMSGIGTPYYSEGSGGWLGLTQNHDRSMLIRSMLEGVSYHLRLVLESMEQVLGRKFDTVRLSGGGAESKVWSKIQADVCGRPLEKLKENDCTTLGAAILGSVATNVFDSLEQAVDNMVHTVKVIEPDQDNKVVYDELYDLFCSTNKSLIDSGVYKNISEVQERLEDKK